LVIDLPGTTILSVGTLKKNDLCENSIPSSGKGTST